MAKVPDTDDFTLSMVTFVLSLGSGNGLLECFNNADDDDFDSTHNPNSTGKNNNLLNFRNYDTSVAPIKVDASTGYSTSGPACSSSDISNSFYFLNNTIADGVTVFTNPALSNTFSPLFGQSGFFFRLDPTAASGPNPALSTIQINSSGVIMDPRSLCA